MRTAIFLAAAAAWFTVATPATAAEQSFQHGGYTYVYTTADAANGAKLITGHRLPDKAPFRLVVKGRHVTGTSGRTAVAFNTAQARGAAGGIAAVGR